MEANQLRIFIESTIDYFQKVTGIKAEAGLPRTVEESDNFLSDITGAIGIAGDVQGAIYLTGTRDFFAGLLASFNPESERSDENILDAAGELANTIAGNGQKVFGNGLRISVPMIITGNGPQLRMREPRYLIPIQWNEHRFSLVIGINDVND
ncbi:MAG: chemotaxis protein CheX [Leptospiraceae bacterium]|nr:chemotaxis protein CheX [Leptospiraceae bacterium]